MRLRFRLPGPPLIVLMGYVPGLVAQQYCLSGTVVSTLDGNFQIGDPVAITATVQSGTVSCSSFADGVTGCNAKLSVDIASGAHHWTNATLPPAPYDVFLGLPASILVTFGNLPGLADIQISGPLAHGLQDHEMAPEACPPPL